MTEERPKIVLTDEENQAALRRRESPPSEHEPRTIREMAADRWADRWVEANSRFASLDEVMADLRRLSGEAL